ncbi:MAG: NUDIX domain-containing protein, partial [Bacteroidales bacterium]
IDSTEGIKLFQEIASEMLDQKRPDLFNQAMMEFGAMQCIPKSPDCSICPLNDKCVALAKNRIDQLPVKQGKTKIRPRYFHFFDTETDQMIWLEQRQGEDIWKGLFQLHLIESDSEEMPARKEISEKLGTVDSIVLSKSYKHILSHQHLYCRFYKVKMAETLAPFPILSIPREELEQYAIPRIIEKYFEEE